MPTDLTLKFYRPKPFFNLIKDYNPNVQRRTFLQIRKELGFTQQFSAAEMEILQPTLSAFERGITKSLRKENNSKLCQKVDDWAIEYNLDLPKIVSVIVASLQNTSNSEMETSSAESIEVSNVASTNFKKKNKNEYLAILIEDIVGLESDLDEQNKSRQLLRKMPYSTILDLWSKSK